MRKIASIILVIVLLGAGAIFVALKRADVHYSSERRSWKNRAIEAITNDLKDPDHLKKRFGETPKPSGEFDTSESQWLTADTIVCRDASWLAFRGQCHKEDPKVHDIFITKASDGKWYFSDYHFCKKMMMLASNGQPESLEQFKKEYFLVLFDGVSDNALHPTWNISGEQTAAKTKEFIDDAVSSSDSEVERPSIVISPAKLNRMFKEAEEAFANKDYSTAVTQYEELVKLLGPATEYPHEMLYFQIGLGQLLGRKYPEAASAFRDCIQRFPKGEYTSRAYLGLGQACVKQDLPEMNDEALEALKMAAANRRYETEANRWIRQISENAATR